MFSSTLTIMELHEFFIHACAGAHVHADSVTPLCAPPTTPATPSGQYMNDNG